MYVFVGPQRMDVGLSALVSWYSIYLLYSYKSPKTDASRSQRSRFLVLISFLGTHFTCFTCTKVQILTQKALSGTLFYEQGLLVEAEGAFKMSIRLGLN